MWHIFGKATGDQSGSQNQWGGGSGWWSKDACWLFNQGKCTRQAADCHYRCMCVRCGKEGHVEKDCSSKKGWTVWAERWVTKASKNLYLGGWWGQNRTNSIIFIDSKATTMPKCRGTEWWSMDKGNMWLPQSVQNLLSNKHQTISKTTYSPSELTFVESVIVGLQEGLWPSTDSMKDSYLKTWDGSWWPLKTEKEHLFQVPFKWISWSTESEPVVLGGNNVLHDLFESLPVHLSQVIGKLGTNWEWKSDFRHWDCGGMLKHSKKLLVGLSQHKFNVFRSGGWLWTWEHSPHSQWHISDKSFAAGGITTKWFSKI